MALRDNRGFDEWSANYDEDVEACRGYPFAGYRDVLATITARAIGARSGGRQTILDLGIGTGELSVPLYERGCRIIGVDFSAGMLAEARTRMPDAVLIECDLQEGLPSGLASFEIDHAISSYCLHHFDLQQKVHLLGALARAVRAKGRVIVGDVGFPTQVELAVCREASGEQWDDSECYLVADELQALLAGAGMSSTYTQVSTCAGVLEVVIAEDPTWT